MQPNRKAPDSGWNVIGIYPEYTAYQKGKYCALSSVCYIEDEHLPPHWEWLISFSGMGAQRLSDLDIKKCLKDFEATDFEEDNHERGITRKFWLAVEHKYRIPCPCKDEKIIIENDYKYSVKKD